MFKSHAVNCRLSSNKLYNFTEYTVLSLSEDFLPSFLASSMSGYEAISFAINMLSSNSKGLYIHINIELFT